MNGDFEASTSEALEALAQGETVEGILNRYPADADALRPILELANELQTLPLAYSVSSQQVSRQAMLAEARRLRGRSAPAFTRFSAFRRLSFALGALLVLFVATAALLAQPVSGALPGQPLYPVKRAAERLQLRLATDPALLDTRLREERREELQALLATGAEAEVDCFGTIRTVSGDRWQVDDFELLIPDDSTIDGEPAPGAPLEGRCLVRDGQVLALDVRITGPGKLPPERPTSTPTPTPTVTPTPTPTMTVTPESSLPGGTVSPIATPDDDHGDDNGDGDDDAADDSPDDSSGSGDDDPDDGGDDSGGGSDDGDPNDDGDDN